MRVPSSPLATNMLACPRTCCFSDTPSLSSSSIFHIPGSTPSAHERALLFSIKSKSEIPWSPRSSTAPPLVLLFPVAAQPECPQVCSSLLEFHFSQPTLFLTLLLLLHQLCFSQWTTNQQSVKPNSHFSLIFIFWNHAERLTSATFFQALGPPGFLVTSCQSIFEGGVL